MGDGFLEVEPTEVTKPYHEIFRDNFPTYLAIGMSATEYWDGDPELTRYYRRAFQLKQEFADQGAWLSGMYVYSAISSVVENIFKKKGQQPVEYPNRPFLESQKEEIKAKKQQDKITEAKAQASVWMEQLVNMYKQ